MPAIDMFIEKAKTANKKLVLPEGQDPRVVTAANKIIEAGVASQVFVLGTEAEIAESCSQAGITERRFDTLDYLNCSYFEEYAEQFKELRKKRNISIEKARTNISDRIFSAR